MKKCNIFSLLCNVEERIRRFSPDPKVKEISVFLFKYSMIKYKVYFRRWTKKNFQLDTFQIFFHIFKFTFEIVNLNFSYC